MSDVDDDAVAGDSDASATDDYGLDEGVDPASIAAAEPEPTSPEAPVFAVGIGPGNPEYLTPCGRQAITGADVLVGFKSVVEFVEDLVSAGTQVLTCGYRDEGETLADFGERVAEGARGTAVLMGDPNHSGYQFLGKVEAAVDCPVRVIPGISSLQIAASRARTPMEETTFVTLHKSGDLHGDLARLRDDVGDRHLLVLPRPYDWMPGDIAAALLDAGAPDCEALVLEHLTHDEESIHRSTLSELAAQADGDDESRFSDLSVLAIRRE